MRTLVFFFLLISLSISPCNSWAEKITVFQGRVLFANFNGAYKEVLRTESPFYGYGLIDKDEVFVAYQPDGEGEAFAVIVVYDLKRGTKKKITEIGGTGESHFAVHPKLRLVVFNDSTGVHLLSVQKAGDFKISPISSDTTAFAPFWLNNNTIGYLSINSETSTFKKISINSSVLQGNSNR